jgi:UDP-arabinose 4-epimerase
LSSRGAILVTGGAGYIGSHACKALRSAGYEPIAYDNLVNGHEWAVKWGPLERGDILDSRRLDEVFKKYKPVAVMHFAAFAYVGESVQNPAKYYNNNVCGSLSLLEAMIRHNVRTIVFSSTCATYGIPGNFPITEHTPQNPINPYGASKMMVEWILKDFEVPHRIRWSALRYFNAAGADPCNEIGESHDPETHIIPLVLHAIAGRRPSIDIFGDDYNTPDGTCIRDYIHVTDLAEAHVLALQSLNEGGRSRAYNLGNGVGFSVRDIIAAAEHVAGKKVRVTTKGRRVGDPPRLVADATLAARELGWRPRITVLDEIVLTAWRWTLKQATEN